jgi:hypothetical protein
MFLLAALESVRSRENMVGMKADLPSWLLLGWNAAKATLVFLGSKRMAGLLLVEAAGLVAAWYAFRAPENKRWETLRSKWLFEIRDVFIVIFAVGIAVFGYQLWRQPAQSGLFQVDDSQVDPSTVVHRLPTSFRIGKTSRFSAAGDGPICVQVLLPQGFAGGSYQLPFKPVAPSPPTLYDNGSERRRGLDYTVSDSTVRVKFQAGAKDSLSVWYTTDDPFPRSLAQYPIADLPFSARDNSGAQASRPYSK